MNKYEKLSVLGLSVLALIVLYLIFNNVSVSSIFYATKSNSSDDNFANITNKTKTVRKKSSKSPFWVGADMGDRLSKNDRIFTAQDSSAKIDLRDGKSITLNENTLVVVEDFKGVDKSLTLEKGSLTTDLSKDNSQMEIKVGKVKTIFNTKNSKAKITVDSNGQMNLAVTEGEVKVVSEGKDITVLKDQNIKLDSKSDALEVELESKITLINPSPEQRIYQISQKPIRFTWSVENPKNPPVLEVSTNEEFENPVVEKKLDTSQEELSLEGGKYYWRIRSNEVLSDTRTFEVFDVREPIVTHTSLKAKLLTESDDELVEPLVLSWKDSQGKNEKDYQVEISTKRNFDSIYKKIETPATTSEIKKLPPGRYFWRVRKRFKNDSDYLASWSDSAMITVEQPEPKIAVMEEKNPEVKNEELVEISDPTATRNLSSEPILPAPYGILSFNPKFYFTKISGTQKSNGTKATFFTSLNAGGDFQYSQVWSPRFTSAIYLGTSLVNFQSLPNKTLENKSSTYSRLGILGQYSLTDTTSLGGQLGMHQGYFYHANSLTVLVMDAVFVPDVTVSLKQLLVRRHPYLLGVEPSAAYYFGTTADTYDVESGYSLAVKLFLEQSIGKNSALTTSVFYHYTRQDSSILELISTDSGVTFGFTYYLRDNKNDNDKK